MAETFEAYRNRVLSYLGDEEPIGVQQATPSQLERRLRDVAPEELIRRPAPEKWSIAEIVAHLADAELAMGWRLRNMLANPGVALTWWRPSIMKPNVGTLSISAHWFVSEDYRWPESAMHVGNFSTHQTTHKNLIAIAYGASCPEYCAPLFVSPPTAANRLSGHGFG